MKTITGHLVFSLIFAGVGSGIAAGQSSTSTGITASSTSPKFGQPVTFTVTVSPPSATGSVTLFSGVAPIGSAQLASGTANIVTSALPAGKQNITARYSGSPAYLTSVSAPLVVTSSVQAAGAFSVVSNDTGTFPPVALVTADFNGDGIPDIAFASSLNTINVEIGRGDGTFATGSTYTVPIPVSAMLVGDFNLDGKPDIACVLQSVTVVFPGNGDGTFGTAVFSNGTVMSATDAVVADFNNDGKPDLAVGNYVIQGVYIALGNGDSTFQNGVYYPTADEVGSVAVTTGDFNEDGNSDVIIATLSNSRFVPKVAFLAGLGDGTFPQNPNPPSIVSQIYSPTGIAAGDFNNDGHTDIVFTDGPSNSVVIVLGNGDGTFQLPLSYPVGVIPQSPVTGDFDGDGNLDVAVLDIAANRLILLLGRGDGTFQPEQTYAAGIAPTALMVADFNRDGRTDLAIVSQSSNNLSLLLGKLPAPVALTLNPNPAIVGQPVSWIATVPVDATGFVLFSYGGIPSAVAPVSMGIATLASYSSFGLISATYLGDANYAAGTSSLETASLTGTATSISMTAFPINPVLGQTITLTASLSPVQASSLGRVIFYDGTALLGTAPANAGVAVYTTSSLQADVHNVNARYIGEGTYSSSSSPALSFTVRALPAGTPVFGPGIQALSGGVQSIATGDLNGDGKSDFLAIGSSPPELAVYLGNNDGTFLTPLTQSIGLYPVAVALGDFNGDGKQDAIVVDQTAGAVDILLGNGDGTFGTPTSIGTGLSPSSVVIADFNGDGYTDFAVAASAENKVNVFMGNGNGTFLATASVSLPGSPTSLAIGDFNRDGKADVVASLGSTIAVLLGNGDGTFGSPVIYAVGSQCAALAVADLNGDGIADVAAACQALPWSVSILLGNGDGTFRTVQSYPVSQPALTVGAADLNGDGSIDLAVPTDSGIFYLMNNGDGTFQGPIDGGAGARGPAVALGDFNSDGKTDVLVGNGVLLGQGSPCSYAAAPTSLYYSAAGGSDALTITPSDPTCGLAVVIPTLPAYLTSGGIGVPPNVTGLVETTSVSVGGTLVPVTIDATDQVFTDVPPSAYYFDAVNTLKAKNITAGCDLDAYCPTQEATRAEMAIFLIRSILGTGTFTYSQTPHFTDVQPPDFGFAYIQKLFELGITAGCGGNDFCPNDSVTRDQMAIFIIRARYGAATVFDSNPLPYFQDVPATDFAFRWVQRMKQDNITAGCAPTLYCPSEPVTRGDMALFLMRGAFNQFLPPGVPVISAISPAAISNNTTASLAVQGVSTHFVQGATTVNAIPGLVVNGVTVTSPTSLTVSVTASESTPQPVSIWITDPTEEAILPNGLLIQ